MRLNFILKATGLLLFLTIQFFALELFEKVYYQFEERYMVGKERLKDRSLINIANPAIYRLTFPESEDEPLYREDGFGFRPWNIDYEVKRGKRFLFVGSVSMGFGTGVTVDKNFPSVFFSELKKLRPSAPFEVINANRGELSLSATFHELQDVLFTKFRPDVVVLGTHRPIDGYPRNEGRTLEERIFGNRQKEAYRHEVKKGDMLFTYKLDHSDFWKELHVKSLLMAKLLTYLDLKMFETLCSMKGCDSETVDYAGYLYDLHEFLARRGIPLIVVELVDRQINYAQKVSVVNSHVRESCGELGVPYLSIAELRPIWSYTWVAGHHYSAKSNRLIGGDIAKWADEILDENFQLKRRGLK
ncbi:MAG: hypothetical protein HZA16_03530 [Nitrospirae bacterium]|nr:hypothetical protein [Nitrospirota bacterium]